MSPIRKLLPPIALVSALALVPVTASSFAAADTTNYQELEKFMSVYQQVKQHYVVPVDDHALIKGAIDGMLSSLDPHSSYAEGADYDALKTLIEGSYGGLGLSVGMEDGTVKVITPTEDTPAWRAGIKAGDYITHINGELMYGYNLDEAVEKMRGKPGSPIKLTLVRKGRDKPFDVTLVREEIKVHPVKWEVKEGVGYININQFAAGTGEATEAAITAIDKATGGHPLGYIVDLRSNPGGSLDEAIQVSDAFLDSGEIVSQRGREKDDIQRYYAKPGDLTHGLSAFGTARYARLLGDFKRSPIVSQRGSANQWVLAAGLAYTF